MEGRVELKGRRGRRRKQLLDDLKETRGYWKLKEEAPDHTLWRSGFGRGSGNCLNPLQAELNPICHLLALLGARHILHISRIRVKVDCGMNETSWAELSWVK